jgi:hypothetical protein
MSERVFVDMQTELRRLISVLSAENAALKAKVAELTAHNKQSTPCHWCEGVRAMLNHDFCSNCGRDLR